MGTETVKSTTLTNRDATPQKPVDLRNAGRSFSKRAVCTATTGVTTGSLYGFFSIPSNAVIQSVELSCAALSTSTAADFGVYKDTKSGGGFATTQAGGTANSKQCFGAAVDLSAALTKSQKLFANSSFYTVANAEKKLWDMLGLSSDPMIDYDVVLTTTATVTAGGAILVEIAYKLV